MKHHLSIETLATRLLDEMDKRDPIGCHEEREALREALDDPRIFTNTGPNPKEKTMALNSAEFNVRMTDIAKKHFNVETLEGRGRDALDFKEVNVWSMRDALEEAFEAGAKHAASRS